MAIKSSNNRVRGIAKSAILLRSFLIFYDVRHRRLAAAVAACRFSPAKQLNVLRFIFGSLNLILVPLRERGRKTEKKERQTVKESEKEGNEMSDQSSKTNLLFPTAFVLPMVFLSHVDLSEERMLMSINATCPINDTSYIS